jgi:hypothetical protein
MSLKVWRAYLRIIGPENAARSSHASFFFGMDAYGLRAFHRKTRGY